MTNAPIRGRSIYRDDFECLHEGAQRMAKTLEWQIIERPTEGEPDPRVITLEHLGLERLRPVAAALVAPIEEQLICETCINRHNPPGAGPCAACDVTTDGEASHYCAEIEPAFEGPESDDDFEDEDDEDEDDEDTGPATLEGT